MDIISKLKLAMIDFDKSSAERIQHFLKVHSFAHLIATAENLDSETLFILEVTALTHDIGIRPATEKYGYCNGKLQEEIGPSYAKTMLENLGIEPHVIERVCYLISRHHTYTDVDGLDYRILLEADFLVNLYENDLPMESVTAALKNIFRTETGTMVCKTMFGV